MSFPRKWTRRLVIGYDAYLWHAPPDWILDHKVRWMTIRHERVAGQVLYADLYLRDFPFGPAGPRLAIHFALEHGWRPKEKALPLYVWARPGAMGGFTFASQERPQ
jgi:hypothetical protein